MDTVRDILRIKGNVIYTVNPDSSVYDALELLEGKNLGSLVVVEKDGTLDGIFTERDYARKVVLQGKFSKDIAVLVWCRTGSLLDDGEVLLRVFSIERRAENCSPYRTIKRKGEAHEVRKTAFVLLLFGAGDCFRRGQNRRSFLFRQGRDHEGLSRV